jgi:serine/threonine protein kinase
MYSSKENNTPLKLRGFGVACLLRSFPSGRCPPGKVGIPQFMAPEMVEGRAYGSAVDVWSAGCIVYLMLSGKLPFSGLSGSVYTAIVSGSYSVSYTHAVR